MALALKKREERATIFAKAQAAYTAAEKEGRAMSGEEEGRWQAHMADVDRLEKEIRQAERMDEVERQLNSPLNNPEIALRGNPVTIKDINDAQFRSELRHVSAGRRGATLREFRVDQVERIERLRKEAEKRAQFFYAEGRSVYEARALQADSLSAGGATYEVEQFVAALIKSVDDYTFIRNLATVIPVTTSDSLGVPTLAANPSDADWTSEVGDISADSSMAFGKRELHPKALTKYLLISNKLLRTSALNIEGMVADRLGYKFGITAEKSYLTGTGAGQPLGVFTASADGIPTSRDITAAATTVFTADEVLDTYHNVKQQYMASGTWIMHRASMARVRKLKDGQGQYLLTPGVNNLAAQPGYFDMLLNRPVCMSEYAPSTFTAGLYTMIFGDFSQYWIAESLNMRFQRLVELKALNDQVVFVGRLEVDAAPVLSEAFSRLILHA